MEIDGSEHITIGRPLGNVSCYIVNEANERIEAVERLESEIQAIDSTTSGLASKLIETAVSLASEAVQNNTILEAEIEDLRQQIAMLSAQLESMRN